MINSASEKGKVASITSTFTSLWREIFFKGCAPLLVGSHGLDLNICSTNWMTQKPMSEPIIRPITKIQITNIINFRQSRARIITYNRVRVCWLCPIFWQPSFKMVGLNWFNKNLGYVRWSNKIRLSTLGTPAEWKRVNNCLSLEGWK